MGRINKTRINFKALDDLIKAFDRKISIKVGIIGSEASQKVEGTDLTYAELGAVHEFGATITVTDKMRKYLHSQGLHLKKDTMSVVIPTRSFLRMPILGSEGKKEILDTLKTQLSKEFQATDYTKEQADKSIDNAIHFLAEMAYFRVMKAFDESGLGKWAPLSEFTLKRRHAPSNPILVDTGGLQHSISYSVNNKKWAKPPYGDLK